MPTIEELRTVWPSVDYVTDEVLLSPWFHIGVLRTGLAKGDRLSLSVAVITEALESAERADRS